MAKDLRAGRLGAHLLAVFRDRDWVTDRHSSRAVRLTGSGEAMLRALEAG